MRGLIRLLGSVSLLCIGPAAFGQVLNFDPQQKTAWIHREWKADQDAKFLALRKKLEGQVKDKADAVRVFDEAFRVYSGRRTAESVFQMLFVLSGDWLTEEEKGHRYRKAQLQETLTEWSSPASYQYARAAFIATARALNGTAVPLGTVRRLYDACDGDLPLERSLVDVMSTFSGLENKDNEWMFAKASELFRRTGEYIDARHRIQVGGVRVFFYGTKKVADEEIGFLRRVEREFRLVGVEKEKIERGIAEYERLKRNLK